MKSFDKTTIMQELKSLLLKNFPGKIEKILLFGSRATGHAKKYSDYDVLLVLNGSYDWRLKNKVLSSCYEIDLKYDILLDVKIISHGELSTLRGKQPFILNALEYGVAV
jgi:predicted nucleotidyltransferase